MNKRASISAGLRADATGWKKGCDTARAETEKLKRDVERMKINGPGGGMMAGMKAGIGQVIGKYAHLRAAVSDVTTLVSRSLAAPAAYADMRDQLTAITGSAEEAQQALDFLAGVAEEQKLEFEPLVAAYDHLRSMGYSAQETAEFVREMGNAIEATGGQSSELEAVATTMAKITDKGAVNAKQLIGMSEQMTYLRTVFKDQFGAETAADLEKLNITSKELFNGVVAGLKKMETAKGSALDASSPEYLASMGRLRTARASNGLSLAIPNLPERQQSTQDATASREAIQNRAREESREKTNQLLRDELDADEQIAELEMARALGHEKITAELEDQAEVRKRVNELQKDGAKLDADQLVAVQKIVSARRADKEAIQAAENAKKTAAADDDYKLATLRHMGQNGRANRLEDKNKVKGLIDGGLDEKSARYMVDRERDMAEDEGLGEGRRRIRQKKSAPAIPIRNERAPVKTPAAQKAEEATGGGVVMSAINMANKFLKDISDSVRRAPNQAHKPSNA